jgi:hypothetical protein
MPKIINRPDPKEYNPYHEQYISKITESNAIQALENELKELLQIWKHINQDNLHFRYTEGKWTLIEVITHIIDTERIMLYRALRFSKGDNTELSGFDQDYFVAHSDYAHYSKDDLVEEFENCRKNTLSFFKHLSDKVLSNEGIANKNKISVRALAWTIAGHSKHHFQILSERYLKSL